MPNFPNSFDTDASLFLAVNNLKTKLATAVDASTLTINVSSTSNFPSSGFITIISSSDVTQAEAIRYTSKDATHFFASQRGADGTTARSHGVGSDVGLFVIAAHHNELKDAIIALEQYVGVSGVENFLRVDDFGAVTISGLLTVQKPNTPTSFVLIDPSGSITIASGSSTNLTRIQDQFITTGFITTTGTITAGGTIIAPSGTITNIGGTGNVTYQGTVFGATVKGTTVTGTTGQFAGALSGESLAVSTTATAITFSGTTGRFAGQLSSQSLNVSNTITATTITGTAGQFGGQVSAQTLSAATITGTTGRFADGLSSQTITSNSGSITGLGGSNATFTNTFGTNATFSAQLQAATVTGTNVQVGQKVSAQTGEFSFSLSVSGIPVQLQAVTSGGGGGIVTSVNALSGDLTLVGTNGNTVTTAGISTINVNGFRSEFLSASGTFATTDASLQSQINSITPHLPVKGTKTFTTSVVDRAGGELRINESFNTRSLIRKLKVSPTVSGVNSYLIQFFTKNTFSFDDLLEYEATASGVYVDNELWFHEDADATSNMHLSITNSSNFDSTFLVELKFERFE